MTRLKFLSVGIVLACAATLYGSPNGTSIAINFAADEYPDMPDAGRVEGAAGVLGTVNWNNFEFLDGIDEPLEMDVSGAASASTATIEWVSANTWSSAGRGEDLNDAPEGDDRALMLGYLDTNATDPTLVAVSDLDAAFTANGYDVYVYALGGVLDRGGDYTIGDETQFHVDTALPDIPDRAFDGEFIEGEEGQYLVFRGLTEASFELEAQPTTGGNPRAPVNAIEIVAAGGEAFLQAGDANMDLEFNQLDLVQVQIAAKYLTGQDATWGQGDWNGAPGGSPGNPPAGDNRFDQLDIIAALNANVYLKGPYAALAGGPGVSGDGQTSIMYNPTTGELGVDAPAGTELTSINIDSAASIFTGEAAMNLGGSFDNDADNNIFKATFGSSFGSLSFGNVAQVGLSKDVVLADLTAVGSLAGGGDLGAVDLIYVPEPTSLLLALLAAMALIGTGRRHR